MQDRLRVANELAGALAERIVDLEGEMRIPWRPTDPVDDASWSPETRRLHERNETLRLQLDVARAHEDELTTELVTLRGFVGDITDRSRELDDVLEELREEVVAADSRHEELESVRGELEGEANRLAGQVSELTAIVDQSQTELREELARRTSLDDRVAELVADLESASARLDVTASERQAAVEEAARLEALSADHLQQIVELGSARLQLGEQVEQLSAELTGSTTRGTELESSLAVTTAHAAEIELALATSTAAVDEIRRELGERVASLEAEAIEGRAALERVGALEASLLEAESRAEAVEGEVAQAQSRAADVTARIAHAEDIAATAEAGARHAEDRAAQAEGRIADAEARSTAGETRIAELARELDAATARAREQEAPSGRVQELEALIAAQKLEIEEIGRELEDRAAHIRTLEAEAESTGPDAEITEELQTRVEALETSLSETRAALEGSGSELEEARDAVVVKEAELASAMEQLAEARSAAIAPLTTDTGDATRSSEAPRGDLDAELAELGQRLEQSESRARRAYAAAEAAEAALAIEKERFERFDGRVDPSGELSDLRSRVAQLLQRVTKAEDGRRKAETDLAAIRAGIAPKAPGEVLDSELGLDDEPDDDDLAREASSDETGSASDADQAGGLRARLAGAAASPKSDRTYDADEWR
ncbi:MAG: hypothetical protein ACRDGK_03305 [Actinomycetota bacterium]